MQILSKKELLEINGGKIYRWVVCDECSGVVKTYFWNSETGECTNVIGNVDAPCEG